MATAARAGERPAGRADGVACGRGRAPGWKRAVRRPDPRSPGVGPAECGAVAGEHLAGAGDGVPRRARPDRVADRGRARLPPAARSSRAPRSMRPTARWRTSTGPTSRSTSPTPCTARPGSASTRRSCACSRATTAPACGPRTSSTTPPAPGRTSTPGCRIRPGGRSRSCSGRATSTRRRSWCWSNAVYLKAKWLEPFAHQDTTPAAFHAPGGTVEVPTMHQTGTFGYNQGAGYQALELRYRGGRLAFDVLLPSPGGLGPVLSRLAGEGPLALLGGLRQTQVAVALPKFRLTTHVELAGPLRGARDAARVRARARRPVRDRGQARRPVHQRGRPRGVSQRRRGGHRGRRRDRRRDRRHRGAGATAGSTFIADRPFVFVLRDIKTGAVLFTGVVSRP